MTRGKFITVEGTEGSGKTLQMERIASALRQRGFSVRTTLEPGGTRFGKELREILLRTGGAERLPLAELLIYLADRCQHVSEVVEPALRVGTWVLSDRYHDATLAYQGFARGIGIERIQHLSKPLELPVPDLTILFDIEVEVGLARARSRNRENDSEHMGRFEAEDLYFHQRVREGYRLLAESFPERIVLIDGRGTPEEVFARVIPFLDGCL